MKKFFLMMLASVFLLLSEQIYAQCAAPGSVTTSISTTPNTCAGNGSITATFTSLTNTTIQLLKTSSEIIKQKKVFFMNHLMEWKQCVWTKASSQN